ncbi:4Fe-4S ferredoxin [Propionigenium maris DSM 9537]|uniref:4Fe-4S ferredoxin n=1 Tax=Propionigenium maris DSM 9537 TaxID=1123000 RepID=A0A9W6GQF0_9FUSO|nr:4Fe-4S binding protein [Propionigenium maris]GLI58332.1 4Fe-4S ferredoxin [Propionigenium maris DSM 9537]
MLAKTRNIRWAVQMGVLLFVTVIGILHQRIGGGIDGVASVHALCPFGALESFYSLVTKGEFIKKVFYSNIVFAVGSTVLTLIFGRIFCGWICALGTLQDLFGRLGMKIFKRRYTISREWDGSLRYMKYVVLLGIIYFTWRTGQLVINSMDPFVAYSHIAAGMEELLKEYAVGFGILVAMLLSSVFYERLFCRYLCPLGAYYSIVGRFSFFKIKRKKSSCVDCKMCDRSCPAALDISSSERADTKGECLSCMKCVEACPTVQNSLEASVAGKGMSGRRAGVAGVGLFLGIILVTKITGIYQSGPNTLEGVLRGNPDNIRGWMSIEEVAEGFDVPLERLYLELGTTMEKLPPETTIKNSEKVLEAAGIEFDHDQIGEVVAALTSKEVEKVVEGRLKESATLRGRMTLAEVSDYTGLSFQEIVEILEIPGEVYPEDTLKEVAGEQGVEVSEMRERLNRGMSFK